MQRTIVHSDRFQKMSCFCAKLSFLLSRSNKIEHPVNRISFCFLFFCSKTACFSVESSHAQSHKICMPFSEMNFYLFTIIAHNFVYVFIAAISSNESRTVFFCCQLETERHAYTIGRNGKGMEKDSILHFLAYILQLLKRHIIKIAKGRNAFLLPNIFLSAHGCVAFE